jgi:hypothetical protein
MTNPLGDGKLVNDDDGDNESVGDCKPLASDISVFDLQ